MARLDEKGKTRRAKHMAVSFGWANCRASNSLPAGHANIVWVSPVPCLAIPRHNGLATAQLDRSLGVEGCRAQCRPHGLTGLAAKFKCAGVSCILRVPVGSSTVQIHSAQGACASLGALAHDLRFPAPSTQCRQTVRWGETDSKPPLPQTIGSVFVSSS